MTYSVFSSALADTSHFLPAFLSPPCDLCAQCLWPLNMIDDIDTLCLPASDPRVEASSAVPLEAPQAPAAPQQQHLQHLMPPPPTHGTTSFGAESDASDELQRMSNVLFQPSPACSPYVTAQPPPAMLRLPSVDSLPPSTYLGPAGSTGRLPADMFTSDSLTAFELPPPAANHIAAHRPRPPASSRAASSTASSPRR